jgi:fructokinase
VDEDDRRAFAREPAAENADALDLDELCARLAARAGAHGGEHILRAVIVCLGEAIVDLVCEREVDSLAEADEFRPRFGCALANVAVAASRGGAAVALAGGVGEDDWGRWIRDRLHEEEVELRFFSLVAGARTPIAFVTFDHRREASFAVYGEGIAATIASVSGRLEEAIGAASALIFGSNTLVGERERELTLHARALALAGGVPVLFDPNVRGHRWAELELARRLCREACAGAFLVRANLEESRWLAGLPENADAETSAARICALGARIAVVTRGPDGAVMRGEVEAEHPGVEVETVSTLGAGDAFVGTLAAGLAERGWEASRAAEALPAAVEVSARTCTVWQAVL